MSLNNVQGTIIRFIYDEESLERMTKSYEVFRQLGEELDRSQIRAHYRLLDREIDSAYKN